MAQTAARGEQGAIAVMVAMLSVVLTGLIMTFLYAGSLHVARQELQNAADGVAIAGATALRQRGASSAGVVEIQAAARVVAGHSSEQQPSIDVTTVPSTEEGMIVVRARLSAGVSSPFAWLDRSPRPMTTTAYAAIHEHAFNARWPVVVVLLDASASMGQAHADVVEALGCRRYPGEPLLTPCSDQFACDAMVDDVQCPPGYRWDSWRNGQCLCSSLAGGLAPPGPVTPGKPPEDGSEPERKTSFRLLAKLMERYVKSPFPVRNGVVVYNDGIVKRVPPPEEDRPNAAAIVGALEGVTPGGSTNIRLAFDEAQKMLAGEEGAQRTVVLIGDGEATSGGSFWFWQPNATEAAVISADALRKQQPLGTSVFTIETRPQGPGEMRDFMHQVSGAPHTDGRDGNFYFQINNLENIPDFLRAMAQQACQHGPLPGSSGLARPIAEEVVALLREADGAEQALERFAPGDTVSEDDEGFFYVDGGYVRLTYAACIKLAADPGRRLVVRWGRPRLVPPPGAPPMAEQN